MDADYLTDLVRCTGVFVALVASCLAAPEATRHVYQRLRTSAVRTGTTIAKTAQEAWRRIRGHAPADVRHVSGTAYLSDFVGLPDALHVERDYPADTLEARLERLERQVAELKVTQATARQAISQEAAERRKAVNQLIERIEREAVSIRAQITAMEQKALLVDASAVPVIGLGIVLTSIPDVIARSSTSASC